MKRRPPATVRLLGALAVAALLLASGCTSDDDGPGAAETPDGSPGGSTSSTADDDEPQLLDYSDQHQGYGVELEDPADVDQLTGAPDDFVDFITGVLAKADGECDGKGVVDVKGIQTGDHPTAVGSVGGCGGYIALWAVVDGEWKEVVGTQEAWSCADLEKYQPPVELVGHVCIDDAGDRDRYPRAS